MKTYLINMYYPSLREAQESVRQCQDAVRKMAGGNWRVIKAGGNMLSIAFASDMEHRRIAETFSVAGRDDFALLIVEVSAVVGGWIERSVYEWLQGRLARG